MIRRHPAVRFIIAHAGVQHFESAIALARDHRNVWLDTSSYFVTLGKLRSSNARVSFFAFLDMITTVSGVLLLITLLLTLNLNTPPSAQAESSRSAVRDQLEQARAKLEANQAELQRQQQVYLCVVSSQKP